MDDQINEADAGLPQPPWDDDDWESFDRSLTTGGDELRLFADTVGGGEPVVEPSTVLRDVGRIDPSDQSVAAADQPIATAPSGTDPGGRVSSGPGRRVVLTMVAIIAALGAVALVGEVFKSSTPAPVTAAAAAPLDLPATATLDDDFGRVDSADELGSTAQNRRWDAVLGRWGIDRGEAYISEANGLGALRNLAVIDLGVADGSVAATLSGRGVCGVVVRYLDPFNFITLKRVSLYGVWNLERVVNGETTRLTYLADSPSPTVDIRVDFRGSQLDVFVAGTSVTVNDTAGQTSSFVGLIGEQVDSRDCRWSSFRAWDVVGNG